MSKVNWSELVEYDESSPSCLRWKIEIRAGKYASVIKASPGTVAGVKTHRKNGDAKCWTLNYAYSQYRLHRIVYEIMYGNIPDGKQIDHIDGNPFNNQINNLRCVDAKLNNRNMKKHNRGGQHAGVYFEENNGYRYVISHFYDLNGIWRKKRFSIIGLGEELAELCAIEHRDRAIRLLNISGAGYSERHGK